MIGDEGFVKIYGSILTSSVWVEDHPTVRLWITLLVLADPDGYVAGTVPGIANVARITVDECRRGMAVLEAPDPDSRTPENDGRRVEKCEGGWRLLNYRAYREKRTKKQVQGAERWRRWDQKRKGGSVSTNATNAQRAKGKGSTKPYVYTKGNSEDANASLSGRGVSSVSPNAPGAPAPTAAVREVFEHWQQVSGHKNTKLTEQRKQKIRARLAAGFTVAELETAISNACADPFYQGDNDRGRRYDWLESLLANDSRVDRHLHSKPGKRSTKHRTTAQQDYSAATDEGEVEWKV